ncbi:unnamed protein product [Brachionus calyciflorus]|uniref:Uncharacterized protein n=1 Tax=Brachionus calyciflorus TaxID=104777 RepID=A0A814H554_9BILA|nr:unnamed protein product [Brachionus calyciflorus]
MVEINEVWHWEKLGLLFEVYVDMFLKGKQEADGYPENVKTEEKKKDYIKDYYDREGVQLDADKIQKNKAIITMQIFLTIIHNADFSHYVQVFYLTNENMHE